MGIWFWVKSLLGFGSTKPSDDVATGYVSRRPDRDLSASEMLQRVLTLQKGNADWAEIWRVLNPEGDPETQRLLIALRGPHMFVPHVGLNVIEDGCRRALMHDSSADRSTALRAALKSSDPFVRPD